MSRSRKKTPVCATFFYAGCKSSEKEDKRLWHRRMRAAILIRLHNFDPDEFVLPHEREVSDVWAMAKDGKCRFDPREHPKLMRK